MTSYETVQARKVTKQNLTEVLQEIGYDSVEQFESEEGIEAASLLASLAMYDENSDLSDEELYVDFPYPPTEYHEVLRVTGRVMGGRVFSYFYVEEEACWEKDGKYYVLFEV